MDAATIEALRAAFGLLGFQLSGFRHRTANGPDCYAAKGDRIYTVEVKCVSWRGKNRVPPVTPKRRNDDLIAVVFPGGYVFIEPMADHLKLCSPTGYRHLSIFGG